MSDNLSGLSAPFKEKVERVLKTLEGKGYNPRVCSGLRTEAEQKEKVSKGFSQTMNSKHLSGMAADIIDRKLGYDAPTTDPFWQALGDAAEKEDLTWGGRWSSFPDVSHIEQR